MMLTRSDAPPTAAPSNEVSETLAQRLRAETEGEVLFDAPSRGRYATDASIYQIMPVGVLVPKSERDIATALDIARDLKVPVLPRGGGTSQCGQTTGEAPHSMTTARATRVGSQPTRPLMVRVPSPCFETRASRAPQHEG